MASALGLETSLDSKNSTSIYSTNHLLKHMYTAEHILATYPYGLNDNVRGVGNVLKSDESLIVYTLFNKQKRKFRKRTLQRKKRKVNVNIVEEQLKSRLSTRALILPLVSEPMF